MIILPKITVMQDEFDYGYSISAYEDITEIQLIQNGEVKNTLALSAYDDEDICVANAIIQVRKQFNENK